MVGLTLLPAPDPSLSQEELGNWLQMIGAGAAGLIGCASLEDLADSEFREAAGVLAADLGMIVEAYAKHVAGEPLSIIEACDELPGDRESRRGDILRLLSSKTDAESESLDFARSALATRLAQELRR